MYQLHYFRLTILLSILFTVFFSPHNAQAQVSLELLNSGIPTQQPDAYHATLHKELKDKHNLPSGISVFGVTEEAVFKNFHLHGPAADGATLKIMDVRGMPFKKSLLADVVKPRGEFWHIMLQGLNPLPIKQDDVLLLVFYVRGRIPNVAGGEASTGVGIKKIPSSLDTWAGVDLQVGDEWQRFVLPFKAKADVEVGKLEWISALGAQRQQVEFAGISLINYGQTVKFENLPQPKPEVLDYPGRAPNAAWRKAALARIEKIRKGDLTIKVVDAAGKSVRDATVSVNMTKHAFRWGIALVPSVDTDPNITWASEKVLRQKGTQIFNHFTTDIDLKFDRFYGSTPEQREKIKRGLDILSKEFGWTGRGHTMVWPSFNNMPQLKQFENDPRQLHAVVLKHIEDVGSFSRPYVGEWDVVNEPFGNRELQSIIGPHGIIEWYKKARQVVPNATLYINEGLTPGTKRRDLEKFYYEDCKYLVDKGAPLDGIGFQSHIGSEPVDPEKVLASLNRFAALKPGLKLAVTEFDINMKGDKQLEHDYTRDFLIATFSHPAIVNFTMWGFHDPYHWLKYAPLYDEEGKLKPSGQAFMDLVHGAWRTKVNGNTTRNGTYKTRGFLGEYEINVAVGDKTKTVKTVLPKQGQILTITLN